MKSLNSILVKIRDLKLRTTGLSHYNDLSTLLMNGTHGVSIVNLSGFPPEKTPRHGPFLISCQQADAASLYFRPSTKDQEQSLTRLAVRPFPFQDQPLIPRLITHRDR